jgi:hypothetical protein
VVELALLQFGRVLHTLLHPASLESGAHVCRPELLRILEGVTPAMRTTGFWQARLRADAFFSSLRQRDRFVVMDPSTFTEFLRVWAGVWLGGRVEATEEATRAMRESIRYLRYYVFLATPIWDSTAAPPRLVPANHESVVLLRNFLDERHACVASGDMISAGRDTWTGMLTPIASASYHQVFHPKVFGAPLLKTRVAADAVARVTEEYDRLPENAWSAMDEATRDCWRLAFFAQLVDRASRNPDFGFLRSFCVRWHEWDEVRARMLVINAREGFETCPPRLLCYGRAWVVAGWVSRPTEAQPRRLVRLAIQAESLVHALAIWLQWIRDAFGARLPGDDSLPRSLYPILHKLPECAGLV